jgi:hypothetical protein
MERPRPRSLAARRDDYLASALDAEKRAAKSSNELDRKAWSLIASGYRELAQMEHTARGAAAECRADYLASAGDADKRAAESQDEFARRAWERIASNYRDLAARVIPDGKL